MKQILAATILIFTFSSFAKKNTKYEYKKYEKFDFSSIEIEAGTSSPGDLSISPRFRKKFRNKIPERKEFHKEMVRALDAVR